MATELSLWIALGAGLLSFFSPCVLPLVPTYISYLTGNSVRGMSDGAKHQQYQVMLNAIFFVLGFGLVFFLFGLTASALGQLLLRHQIMLRRLAGIIIFLFGVHKTGLLNFRFLQREKRLNVIPLQGGFMNSFLIGIAFSVGWTPCVGPVLSSILLMASTEGSMTQGAWLLIAYSLGLGIPFLLAAVMVSTVTVYFQKVKKYLRVIEVVTGLLLMLIGVLVYFNYFTYLAMLGTSF